MLSFNVCNVCDGGGGVVFVCFFGWLVLFFEGTRCFFKLLGKGKILKNTFGVGTHLS